jgi:hypothetical protein
MKSLVIALGIVFGLILLCCCCCIASVALLSNNSDFRDGYCQGYYDSRGSYGNEPFGWCR